jgi:hypothetical protein
VRRGPSEALIPHKGARSILATFAEVLGSLCVAALSDIYKGRQKWPREHQELSSGLGSRPTWQSGESRRTENEQG